MMDDWGWKVPTALYIYVCVYCIHLQWLAIVASIYFYMININAHKSIISYNLIRKTTKFTAKLSEEVN